MEKTYLLRILEWIIVIFFHQIELVDQIWLKKGNHLTLGLEFENKILK